MLFFNTVSDFLKDVLFRTMASVEINRFRLIGGTALSLQLGHRLSVDIDLFTDAQYRSIDISAIERFLDRGVSLRC